MFECPPYSAIVDDPFLGSGRIQSFDVDFSYGFGFSETVDISEAVLSRSDNFGPYRSLEKIDFLLHLCCHLYKEASNEAWAAIDLDINLIKFCDVREYILEKILYSDFESIGVRIRELGVEKAFHFAIYYVHYIYSDNIVSDMMRTLGLNKEADPSWQGIYRQGGILVGTRQKSVEEIIGGLHLS